LTIRDRLGLIEFTPKELERDCPGHLAIPQEISIKVYRGSRCNASPTR
jgi:hypothetical protein